MTQELTLAQIQQAVDAWISQWDDGYWSPLSNLARLTEEVGELARAINHAHGDKPKKKSESDGDIGEELADILFVVVTLANSLDIDLTQALKATLEKYDVRDADRFTPRGSKKL
jgi:NTP pyrophosphatase (non-canonical NTP hydrolase)